MLTAGLDAIDRGWSVTPCGMDKRPLVRWRAYQDAPPSREEVESWAQLAPASWAVVTGAVSGLFVLDFDGEPGQAHLERFGLTPNAQTGSGGAHVYVEHPGHRVKTVGENAPWAGDLPGLHVRGDGGYAIFAGRNERGPYRLLNPAPLRLEELPAELAAVLASSVDTADAVPGRPASAPPVDDVGDLRPELRKMVDWALKRVRVERRNWTGFELACQVRDNGFERAQAMQALAAFRAQVPAHDHPYTLAEARASVLSAYARSPREPWRSRRT